MKREVGSKWAEGGGEGEPSWEVTEDGSRRMLVLPVWCVIARTSAARPRRERGRMTFTRDLGGVVPLFVVGC